MGCQRNGSSSDVRSLDIGSTADGGKTREKFQFLKPRDDGNGVPARRLYDAQHRHGATNIGLGVVLWGWRLTLVGLENCFYQTFG